jgi:hypothetical protein
VSDVRFSSQRAIAESGTIAPVVTAAVVAGAAEPEEALSTAKGKDVTPEGIPVSVPALMAAAVVDSLFEAAMAAILEATGLVVPAPPPAAGVLVLMEEAAFVLLDADADELLTPALLFELTNCPADVGKVAAAAEGADVVAEVDEESDAAGGAGAVAADVEPRRGTDAEAPVDPVLM